MMAARVGRAMKNIPELSAAIRTVLTPDLIRPKYRGHASNPMYGHYYVASEAMFHLLGGWGSPYQAMRGKDETGDVHWWLRDTDDGSIIDVTADQFTSVGKLPPYANGRAGPFLTKQPSKRAQVVLDRLRTRLPTL
jgi:hypothetical protein